MIETILNDITRYMDYLIREHNYYITFHNSAIPLGNYMEKLATYNISCNPFCLCVKSSNEAWNYCISRQHKVGDRCSSGPFFGMCYAGMQEYVFPIFDKKVLGFISVSGYRTDDAKATGRIRHIAKEYNLDLNALKSCYQKDLDPAPKPLDCLAPQIAPLVDMFILLNREIVEIWGDSAVKDDTQNYILSHVLVYLRRNYASKIKVSDLAKQYYCSVSYISHIFKKRTGKSISDYLNDLRIEDSKKLLQNTKLTVTHISQMVGFADTNYFSNTFKKSTGLPPTAFRKQK